MRALTLPTLVAAFTLVALPALADDSCKTAGKAKSDAELRQLLADKGYTVIKSETDDGCFEAKATDAAGKKVKIKLDPVSGVIIKVKVDD
ncbi:MAG: PepSY domain-containing protein [Magnetospirillum sp.]|nr:PepSY domain-containing protein [Magnetospirillum sp.]